VPPEPGETLDGTPQLAFARAPGPGAPILITADPLWGDPGADVAVAARRVFAGNAGLEGDEVRATGPRTVTVGGEPAAVVDVTGRDPGTGAPFARRRLITRHGGHRYVVSLRSTPAAFGDDAAAYDRLLASWRWDA
jgi:hypothetical protein